MIKYDMKIYLFGKIGSTFCILKAKIFHENKFFNLTGIKTEVVENLNKNKSHRKRLKLGAFSSLS